MVAKVLRILCRWNSWALNALKDLHVNSIFKFFLLCCQVVGCFGQITRVVTGGKYYTTADLTKRFRIVINESINSWGFGVCTSKISLVRLCTMNWLLGRETIEDFQSVALMWHQSQKRRTWPGFNSQNSSNYLSCILVVECIVAIDVTPLFLNCNTFCFGRMLLELCFERCFLWKGQLAMLSATGTRTRVARVRAEYPDQLDYSGDEFRVSECFWESHHRVHP